MIFLRLKEWLAENHITNIAMESMGVYWKPIFNILEGNIEFLLVNARHIKHIPVGRQMFRTVNGYASS
jgi:transposase